jgi:hypothetical protein
MTIGIEMVVASDVVFSWYCSSLLPLSFGFKLYRCYDMNPTTGRPNEESIDSNVLSKA